MYYLTLLDEDEDGNSPSNTLVGLNSQLDFVFESDEDRRSFFVITAKDLFFMLVTEEAKIFSGLTELSINDVKLLREKLASGSCHYRY